MQITVEGECGVLYTIVPESEEQKEMRVTKSIDFENCEASGRVGARYAFRFGDECKSCPENKFAGAERNIESSTVLNYRIAGSESRFVIREVELRSSYVYSPISENDSLFSTIALGKMTLLEESQESSDKVTLPKSEKKETLAYNQEWERAEEKFISEGADELLKQMPYPEMKNKAEVVKRLVKSLVEKIQSEELGVDAAATHEMGRIVTVLRLASKDDLARIHKEICENDDSKFGQEQRDIINDALALAGTANTIQHLMEKIRERQVSPARTAVIFKHLVNVRVPSQKIVDSIVSVCRDLKAQPVQRQSCWLTAGSLMNALCGEHRDQLALEQSQQKNSVCPRDVKEKYVQELKSLFESASTRYEKVLALKTLANSGMDLIVFPLEEIIRDEKQDKSIRIQAVDALRKLRTVMPRKIQAVLLPVYKNVREVPELRVAAFRMILQTTPERAVIDQLTQQLEKEPREQVAHFVHSTLEQYAESRIACESRMAQDIKLSLQLARVQPRKPFVDSHTIRFPFYDEENKMGGAFDWSLLFSNDSVLPKEIQASLDGVIAGQWNKYLASAGVSQQNVDQLLYKLIKKIDEQGIEEILVRGKRSASFRPSDILRGLFTKLSIVTRRSDFSDPHALLYVRFRDMDYALLPLDEEVIPEFLKNTVRGGRIELGDIEAFLAKGIQTRAVVSTFVYERTRQIVTSLGAPILYTSHMPTVAKLDISVSAELLPKNGDKFEGVSLRVKAQPTIASTHVTKVEMVNPIINLGVKLLHSVEANVPVELKSEIRWEDKWEMKTVFTLPKEDRRIVRVQTRPVAFTRVWPKEARTYIETKERSIHVEQLETLVHKLDHSVLEKTTGLKINVLGHLNGHVLQRGVENLPSAILIGQNDVEIRFEKTEETPKEYELTMEAEWFRESSKKMDELRSMESFYEKDAEKHFETESYEEYPENEGERRSAYKTYVKEYKTEKAYRHAVRGQIRSIGARKERRAELSLTAVCDEQMRACTLKTAVERTPVTEAEKQNWKMESIVKVLYPGIPATLEQLSEQKHREITASVKAQWGDDKTNEVEIKIQGEQNKEQKKWVKRVAELKKQSASEKMTSLEERSRLIESAMLNQYKLVAKYDVQSPVSQVIVDRLYSLIKASSPFFRTELTLARTAPRTVLATLTLEPETRQYVNVTVETPFERLAMANLRLPVPLRLVNIHHQSATPVRSVSDIAESALMRSKCTVESRKVNTFDDLTYRAPLTTCYSVLAKDCSSEQPRFAVLMKKADKASEDKKMKVVDRENVVEMELVDGRVEVTINGKQMSEKRVEKKGLVIVRRAEELVSLESEHLKVDFDGFTANIKLSEYYKNKQCGMCGHFDGERTNDFRRADNEETGEELYS